MKLENLPNSVAVKKNCKQAVKGKPIYTVAIRDEVFATAAGELNRNIPKYTK